MATRLVDTLYTLKFIKLLSTKWEDTDAYKLGIIDKKGTPLKKLSQLNSEEKQAYTPFDRLVFKFKRMLEKLPGGKTMVARYSAALLLIKEDIESIGMNYKRIKELLEEVTTGVDGIEGKPAPIGKPSKRCKCKKKKVDYIEDENNDVNEYTYQLFGDVLVKVPLDEKRRVVKKRIINGKRVKRREYVSGAHSKYTRTGNRKLRGAAKIKRRKALKRAVRKAHLGSAEAKRRRSMRKRKIYAK